MSHLNLPASEGNSSGNEGQGKRPKNLHIAHRRSPSELTNLMVEQYNLQRQLEAVQAQQKQLMQQQQQMQNTSYRHHNSSLESMHAPPNSLRSHSRSSSITSGNASGHRRTGSGGSNNLGHARRHSLGLNEAIKAAANQRQSNKNSLSPSSSVHDSPTHGNSRQNEDLGSFKFPANASDADSDSASPRLSSSPSSSHNDSRSLAYGQQGFKFPPDKNTLLPPTPNFSISHSPERSHQRRGSHYRTNSRNFDSNTGNINNNWRSQQQPQFSGSLQIPNNHLRQQSNLEASQPFVPGHRPRNSSYGGNSSVSSISQFLPNNQQQQQQQQNGRKSLFAPYLPQSSLPELINDGRLVTGILRVNKKNRSDAYVSTDGLLDADIFICGSKDRNRALESDFVAVELLVVDEVWEGKKEKEEKKRRKDNNYSKGNTSVLNDDIHNDATSLPSTNEVNDDKDDDNSNLNRRGSLKQRPTMKKNDDVEVEGQSLLLVEEEEINDEVKPLYAGHVVAVVDRIGNQLFAGTLGLLRPAQAAQAARDKKDGKESSVQTPRAPKIVWFKPTDKKVPLIAIPTEQAPKDFVENHEKYANDLFIATIKRWPITSLHPFGTLINKLGRIDDPETEVDAILRDNNFLCDEYDDSENYVNELPLFDSEVEKSNRSEYLYDYIIAFSANGSFVDNALHVKRVSDTKIELGFHVVDVSYFIEVGSILDRKAKKRSSSVFLPQKNADLFPAEVNQAISFKENEKNPAVSVVFEIDTANFEVEDLFIHESIIVPKKVVDYDSVDSILDGNSVENVSSATSDYIKTFSFIAKEFRRQRLNDNSLDIAPNLTLLNQLDDEKVRLDLNIFKNSKIFNIINEISHKVNSAIAAKVHSGLGDLALLRRQSLPTLLKMETFVRKAESLGFKIDTTDAATLQKSILSIQDPIKRQCVEILLYKCMNRGKYYIAGKQDPDSYGHYYLNLPLYTHFTAPLRRYADLVVHRQLKSLITDTDAPFDIESLKAVADYCNFKKDCAANAQEQAIHLLLSQTINDMGGDAGQILCMGTVIQVYESSFDVFLPEFGVEKRVHGDQLPLVKAEFDKSSRLLELYWEAGIDTATFIPPDEKTSLSYRSSIKNKYRRSADESAKIQSSARDRDHESIIDKLSGLKLAPPKVDVPLLETMLTSATNKETSNLAPYLQDLSIRTEGDYNIQEIKELAKVPVLLRAEIGMALPCLTVRVLNPFV